MKKSQKIFAYILSLIVLLSIWIFLSLFIKSSLILPSPLKVFREIIKILSGINFWKQFVFTFLRILCSFLISTITGFLIGYFSSKIKFFKYFCEPFVLIIRVTPVIALILLSAFWFKSTQVPVFVCVLMSLPIMIDSTFQGFESISDNYIQLSKVYNLGRIKTFFKIKLPSAFSYIKTGLISTFGLSWKVVVAGEVLCLPVNGIGTLLQKENLHLETSRVMALTIILIFICFIFEKILKLLLSCKEDCYKL